MIAVEVRPASQARAGKPRQQPGAEQGDRADRREVDPEQAGGAVANVGATAGILLALAVRKDVAINFSLASGLLLVTSASAAAVSGITLSVGAHALARRHPSLLRA